MGPPGTLLVITSTFLSMPPKIRVSTVVGSRLRTPATTSAIGSAGSARWRATSSRTAASGPGGSAIGIGARKRAGTDWGPAGQSQLTPTLVGEGLADQIGGRKRLGLGGGGRRPGVGRLAFEVEEQGGEPDGTHPVGDGVVDLLDHGRPPLGQPVDHGE